MRKATLFFISLLLTIVTYCQQSIVYYSPVKPAPALKGTYYENMNPQYLAEDLAWLLCCATGKKWTAEPYSGKQHGIMLLLNPALPDINNETGHISITQNNITISAKYATGLSYAMYTWLNHLGFKFYLPGNDWMIIPKIKNIFIPFEETYTPAFQMRMFNASGGTPAVAGEGDNGKNRTAWFIWLRRNRMGCNYLGIDGHRGEKYNISHRQEIEQDTNMVAPINGKRKYDASAKLDPTYLKGVSSYINWLADEYQKEKNNAATWLPPKKYQSGDLGDGLNYCHTPECEKQFPSISDQSFYVINSAAQKIHTINPEAGVSTLAYTERADTPVMNIRPDVHVMIVANAFQKVTTSAALIQRWSKKTQNISLYDFLNIGVWQYEHPFINLNDYLNFLGFNRALGIQGVTMETAYSSMAAGVPAYFIMQYLAEPFTPTTSLFQSFCRDMFGPAASDIETIFSLWYNSDVHLRTNIDRPTFYPDELASFIRLLKQAENRRGLSTEQKNRIAQLKVYTAYLCGAYELFQNPEKREDTEANKQYRHKKATALLEFTWSQYNNLTFQNTQLNDLLKKFTTNPDDWNYRKSSLVQRAIQSSPTTKNIFDYYAEKYSSNENYTYNLSTADWATALESASDSFLIESFDEAAIPAFIYPIMIYTNKPRTIQIRQQTAQSENKKVQDALAMISLESVDYSTIITQYVYNEGTDTLLTFQIPAAGHYRLYLGRFKSTPVKWMINTNGALAYINKKSVMRNAIKLIQAPQSTYSNHQLGLFATSAFESMQMLPTKPTAIYSMGNKILSLNKFSNIPYRYKLSDIPASLPSIIYYQNEIIRWPTVIMNTPPYFFFIK